MWRAPQRGLLPLLLFSAISVVGAQEITRDNYYAMVPSKPRIVGQTRASAAFHLYGDRESPAYRDADPLDGVDDARGLVLLAIAERFSPIIRPNNLSIPRDPRDVIRRSPLLHVDRWENGARSSSEDIVLRATVALAGGTSGADPIADSSTARLRQLYLRHGPRAHRPNVASPEVDLDEVMFFDLPGSDVKSWKAGVRAIRDAPTRIFAHPFIYDAPDAVGERRYLLVMQYWFFFTFNNSVNNHEGDWEHINVQITTRSRQAPPESRSDPLLTGAELTRLLASGVAGDSMIVAAVEYHFHHLVMTLDYLNREVVPDERRSGHRHGATSVWEDRNHIRRAIDQRLAAAGGRLATHPLVFIGGNYKGPIELLDVVPRFTASPRRNSHGAYPFAGTWQAVGPLAYIEQVHGHVAPPLKHDNGADWHSLIDDPDYLVYRAADIVLMPDWERLEPLVNESDDALARWGWMLMPLHWGFPASPSIGAGAVKHVDLGNLAPYSPTYKSQWNRVGLSPDRQRYAPHVLRTPVSPTTPWTMLRSGWGILNAPLAVWGMMPGYNVVLVELMPWMAGTMHTLGVPPPKTYTTARLPHRITIAGYGPVWEFGGRDLARLLPPDGAGAPDEMHVSGTPASRFWIALFFDDRFALENTFSVQTATIRRGVSRARLDQRQLTGGVRYTPKALANLDHSFHLYGRAGYGWLQLRARDGATGTTPIADRRDGHLPTLLPSRSWWPNTWYAGAGMEAFAPPRAWLLGRLGYGLRVESSSYFYRLNTADADRVRTRRNDLAASLIFGW